ncbi:MAG: T9SS type A sorting domain-containing protein [Saprospiraceae bacterium]
MCNFLIQSNTSPSLDFVSGFHAPLGGGLEAALLRPKGSGGPLQLGYQRCSPAQLAFVVIDDGCNGDVDFTLNIDIPTPRSGPNVFRAGLITPHGDLTILQNSTANGTTTLVVRLGGNQNIERYGAIVLNYTIAPFATTEPTYTAASLVVDRSMEGCGMADQTVWSDLPDKFAHSITIASSVYFDGTIIRANQLGPGNDEVLILGNPIYVDNFWPAARAGGTRFAMAPNSTLSFGDANNVVAGLTVPNGRFFPCSTQPFNTVEIGPNSDVTFSNPGTNSNVEPLVFGATTGVTVQANAQFTMTDGEIRSCVTGISGVRAQSVTVSNVDINQVPGSVPNSSFVANGARGAEGIRLRTTASSSPSVGQYNFNQVTIDNFQVGVNSGIGNYGPSNFNFRNSTITNVVDGLSLSRGSQGRYSVVNNNITALRIGVDVEFNRRSAFAIVSNIISAGIGGVNVRNVTARSFATVSQNTITGTNAYGVNLQSRTLGYLVNNNNITMTPQSDFRAFGIGSFRNNRGNGTIAGNTVITGDNTFNFGVFAQDARFLNISTNSILLTQSQSTGVVLADSDNSNTNCNQVTTVRAPGGLTAGMELNNNSSGIHSCNLLNNTDKGMQVLGGNGGISYTSNTFNGNSIGLLVGGVANSDDGLSDVLIGGVQNTTDNVWADGAQASRVARHSTRPSLRILNMFSVRPLATYFPANGVGVDANGAPLPVVFNAIPSLDIWFQYSNPSTAPAGCPAACSVLPPNWPAVQPCLPVKVASQDSDFPSFQRQQARLNSKYAVGDDQAPCDGNTLPCYQEIADLEQEFYDLFGSAMDQETYESYLALLNEEQASSEGTFSDELIDEVLLLVDLDSPEDTEIENGLLSLLTKLSDFEPCEEVTALWQESLALAIKQELPDGLSKSEQADFSQIANKCASFEGPGVHIARASLGLAISDGQTCDSDQDSEQLVFQSRKLEKAQSVFPNPVRAGSELLFVKSVTGWVSVTDAYGKQLDIQYLNEENSFVLPSSLTSGLYFIRTQNGEFSSSIAVFE